MGGSILDMPYSTNPAHLTDTPKDKKGGFYIQFSGAGPNLDRQEASHPHEVYSHNDELLVPDLGADKTWRLVRGSAGWEVGGAIEYPAGVGPRHILIHGIPIFLAQLRSPDRRLPRRWYLVHRAGAHKRALAPQVRRIPRTTNPHGYTVYLRIRRPALSVNARCGDFALSQQEVCVCVQSKRPVTGRGHNRRIQRANGQPKVRAGP